MLKTDAERMAYRKRALPGYAEFIAVPEAERSAYVLEHVNAALIKEGLAPIDHLSTSAEFQASLKASQRSKRHGYRRRIKHAWAILKGEAD